MKKQSGFTFLEVIFSLSIAAIIVGIGVPSFVNSIRNSEMVTAANSMVAGLHAARSEAVKTRSRVTLCRSDNSGANPVCSATGKGLAVFLNASDDISFDSGADTLMQQISWLGDDMDTVMGTIPNYVSFNGDGFTRAVGGGSINGSILVCGPSAEDHARVIMISPTGRPTVQKHAQAVSPPACP